LFTDVSGLHVGPILKGQAWINNDDFTTTDIPEGQISFFHYGRNLKLHVDSYDSGHRPVAGLVNVIKREEFLYHLSDFLRCIFCMY